jgi:xanthine/uracil permease
MARRHVIFLFAIIAAVGVGMLADSLKSQRDLLLLAASLGLAMAMDFAPPALFEAVAPSVRVLAADGIVVVTVMAVLLNLVLPSKD